MRVRSPYLYSSLRHRVLESGTVLPSMPALTPVVIDRLQVEEQKPKWPREAVQPELEYHAIPLVAPPDSVKA
jgi:hypothetical protein